MAAAPSRYESQKRRDWKTFLQFLKNHKPPLTQARCSGAHVIGFLKYLDQFGKTKVHVTGCRCFGQPNPPGPCECPLKQAWGSHDALIGRLRAAYEENGGRAESNPFGARAVTIYLREVREGQAKARGIPYEKKKRKRAAEEVSVGGGGGGGGGSSSGGGGDVAASVAPPSSKTNERAMLEKENMLKLEEDAKMENEKLHGRIFDLGKKLDVSQSMELEIAGTMVSIQMAKPMGVEHNMEIDRKMESLENDLKDKEEEIEGLETLNETLVVKEHSCTGELLEARKELIDGLMQSDGNIGVKKMGDLDTKPFQAAAEKKFRGREIERKAAEWCSLWEKYLRDPRWHPFKVVRLGEIDKEILDMEDDRLKALKEELGDEVVKAVTTALTEMNDYNASGRYPVDELWNFQEGRKATLKEGISHLLIQLKLEKQNRNAHT